jgi:hypothetical protein
MLHLSNQSLPFGCHVIRGGLIGAGGAGVIMLVGLRGMHGTLPHRLAVMKALQATSPTTYGNTTVADSELGKALILAEFRGYQEVVRVVFGRVLRHHHFSRADSVPFAVSCYLWWLESRRNDVCLYGEVRISVTYSRFPEKDALLTALLWPSRMDKTLKEFFEENKQNVELVVATFYEALAKCAVLSNEFGMAQLDMKLENMMRNKNGEVKHVDFGAFVALVKRAVIQGTTEAWTSSYGRIRLRVPEFAVLLIQMPMVPAKPTNRIIVLLTTSLLPMQLQRCSPP